MTSAKPSLDPRQSLLINRITLRGPEMARIFEYLRLSGPCEYKDLLSAFVPQQDPVFSQHNDELLKDALGFLVTVGLVAISRNSNSWLQRELTCMLPEAKDFRMELIKALRHQEDPRQAVFMNTYALFIRADVSHLNHTDALEWIERFQESSHFIWNREKLHFWILLMDYLGLVTAIKSHGCIFAPSPKQILMHFKNVAEKRQQEIFPVRDACEQWEADIAACFTERGRLQRHYTQAFNWLESQGHLSFSYLDDSARSILLGHRRVSQVEVNHV